MTRIYTPEEISTIIRDSDTLPEIINIQSHIIRYTHEYASIMDHTFLGTIADWIEIKLEIIQEIDSLDRALEKIETFKNAKS